LRTSSGRKAKPATEPSKCRSCGADILWAITRNEKKMPVDAVPDMRPPPKGGNMVLFLRGGQFGELRVEKYYEPKHGKQNRYTAHWSTCPNADQHRGDR
jgi:hypothetical protein